jgi:protein TIF31
VFVEIQYSGIPVFIKTLAEVGTIQVQVTSLDAVQDVKQFLYETADTCYFTSFDLYLEGQKLNEFTELAQVKGLKPNCTFEMREASYDERSSRLHVRRVREIIGMNFLHTSVSPSVFSYYNLPEEPQEEQKASTAGKKKEVKPPKVPLLSSLPTVQTTASLAEYYPPTSAPPPQCVNSITFSAFNPPPGDRRLQGDLYYLEVVTLENTTLYITAWDWGFYFNSSTHNNFNPTPNTSRGAPSYTLVGLLSSVSPGFRKHFKALLSTPIDKHPFELMQVPVPVRPWVGTKPTHTADRNRAEDSLAYANDNPDIRGCLRDWNEEFQSCKELPKADIQSRIQRDRALIRVNTEFVEVATRGAIAVINKSIPPINPLDNERSHMYIYNNIFFSFALDSRDTYKEIGGDKIAYAGANNDLNGVKLYNLTDVDGLHTVLTAIVDYRGHRVVAQSIIPGILTNDKVSQVVYGSIDNGTTLNSDPAFHELMLKAGKLIHIGESIVKRKKEEKKEGEEEKKEEKKDADEKKEGEDAQNDEPVKLAVAVDSKGIIGTDGRKYILDLIRPTPRNPNFTGSSDVMCVLRPELIAGYAEYLRLKALTSEKKAEGENPEPVEINLQLNPNVFANVELACTEEERLNDENKVKEVAAFLTDFVLPGLVNDFSNFVSTPCDGQTLTAVMHARGINMKYLGKIASLTTLSPVIQAVCTCEMITRATKYIFTAHLRNTENYHLSHSIAHFLNCLLGSSAKGGISSIQPPASLRSQPKSGKKKKSHSIAASSPFNLSHASLWESIITSVKEKYAYELPKTFTISSNHMAYLRSICQKVGVQVDAHDYDFTREAPFANTDIIDIFPIVKHMSPRSADGQELQDAGKSMLIQGRLDMAHELLSEGLAIVHQVHGPLHQDAAALESNLAMVRYSAQDLANAIAHQTRAVVINERVLGLDHHDTAHAYGNLALFCQQAGKNREALGFITRALYLSNLVGGALHPDHGSTYTNVSQILAELDNPYLAVEYLKEALKSNEILFGKNHIITATTCHHIAIAYGHIQQFKEAMNYQKRHFTTLCETVGENDARTKEANKWLNQFTRTAVQKQIEIKNTAAAAQPKHAKKEITATPSAVTGNMGTLPLSEVLRFINTPSRGKRGGIIKLSGTAAAAPKEPEATQDGGKDTRKQKKKKGKKAIKAEAEEPTQN